MSHFESPKIFQAQPGAHKKRLFLLAGLAGAASVAFATWTKAKSGNEPFFFAGGITAVIFALRFYFMQVRNGPARLTFSTEGITMADKKSSESVSWGELEAIRYVAGRAGHHWAIKPRGRSSLDFYLDGLTMKQQEELLKVVRSIELPHVRIEPVYNPLEEAA